MPVAILKLHFYLPDCRSLKAKRSRIKPILARLHKEFNLSTAEVGSQDQWQEAVLACAMVGNESAYLQRALQPVIDFIPRTWPDIELVEYHLEIV